MTRRRRSDQKLTSDKRSTTASSAAFSRDGVRRSLVSRPPPPPAKSNLYAFSRRDVDAMWSGVQDDASLAMTSIASALIPPSERSQLKKVKYGRTKHGGYQIIDRSMEYSLPNKFGDRDVEVKMKKLFDPSGSDSCYRGSFRDMKSRGERIEPSWPAITNDSFDLNTGMAIQGSTSLLLSNTAFTDRFPNVARGLNSGNMSVADLIRNQVVIPIKEDVILNTETEWSDRTVIQLFRQTFTRCFLGKFGHDLHNVKRHIVNKIVDYIVMDKLKSGISSAEKNQSTSNWFFRGDVNTFEDLKITFSNSHRMAVVMNNLDGCMMVTRRRGTFFGIHRPDSVVISLDLVFKAVYTDCLQLKSWETNASNPNPRRHVELPNGYTRNYLSTPMIPYAQRNPQQRPATPTTTNYSSSNIWLSAGQVAHEIGACGGGDHVISAFVTNEEGKILLPHFDECL